MGMVTLKKSIDGVIWNESNMIFTYESLELGYEIKDNIHISLELNSNIYSFDCTDTMVDDEGPFNDSSSLVTKLFT
jgi:hypothetical protein